MASPSAEFRELYRAVRQLRTKFLSSEIGKEKRLFAAYTPDVYKLAAFRLLVHAEIEDYLEVKARQHINAVNVSLRRGINPLSEIDLYALASYFDCDLPLYCPYDHAEFSKRAGTILAKGLSFISDNNGIRRNSFLVLSLLSGKKIWELDDVLANSLDGYGTERGNVAHKSAQKVRTIMGPGIEAQRADDLMKLIKKYFYNC